MYQAEIRRAWKHKQKSKNVIYKLTKANLIVMNEEVEMTAKDDRKNAEGYNDPTAYNAIKNVEQELDKDEARFHQLLNTLFSICELADFHIEERVVLKDKRTGKVWRQV